MAAGVVKSDGGVIVAMTFAPCHGKKHLRWRQTASSFHAKRSSFDHLTAIAHDGAISRSETLERLVRSTDIGEGSSLLSDDAWPFVIDHCSPS
jgi:hypothetical protein